MRQQIIDYISNQIEIDLSQYRTDFTKQWERENEIIIEHKEMERKDFRHLELLCNNKNSKIRMESVGVWGKMICFKKI